MSLTRAAIVETAVRILDEFGLADLSMRRIATALGVQPGALYWHVTNKQSLLAAVADEVLAGLPEPTGPGRAAIRAYARSLYACLLAHRDGAEVVSSVLAMRLPARSPVRELAEMLRRTLPSAQANAAAALLVHFVVGHTLDRQGYAQSRELGVAVGVEENFDGLFRAGLELLLNGITGTDE